MNKPIQRPFINKIEDNLSRSSKFIQVLIGARQVGKATTLNYYLQQFFGDQLEYYSADEIYNSNEDWIVKIWNKALLEQKILVIDEIQKCKISQKF